MKLLLILFALHSHAHAADEKAKCLGADLDKAKRFFVFLHGAAPLEGPRFDARVLKEIADKKQIRFAVPEAHWPCRSEEHKGSACWINGGTDDNAYKPAQKTIEEAADACFKNKEHGLIGFSNGALYVTALRFHCVPNKFTQLIAVGLGGSKGRWDKIGLKGCTPRLDIVVGNKDEYYKNARSAYETLKARDADVTFAEYEGGHVLKAEPLLQLFD